MAKAGAVVHSFLLCAVLTIAVQSDARGSPAHAHEQFGAPTYDGVLFNGLFEGDLKLTEEEISRHYELGYPGHGGTSHTRTERAALSDRERLWPGAIVPYEIDQNATSGLVTAVQDAIQEWEESTCLRFFERTKMTGETDDYVYFTAESLCFDEVIHTAAADCCSDSVGRKGGKQVISLPGAHCSEKSIVMHMIGHAIGFWHEESRPDRDSYISIYIENIKPGAHNQFLKRNDLDVDYQGVGYDYGSIMHLPLTAFSNCDHPLTCPTMQVTNPVEHGNQGSPVVGRMNRISELDGEQANRLYNCPNEGVRGMLRIFVYSGQGFTSIYDDPYVRVIAIDGNGTEVTKTTTTKENTRDPQWNEELLFVNDEWLFFRIQVYNENWGRDEAMSMSETVEVKGDAYQNQTHCLTTACAGKVRYLYEFVEDGDECSTSPCQNGGTCADMFNDFSCVCGAGWSGSLCDINIDCYNNPCRNGGTCIQHIDRETSISTYTCECTDDWDPNSNCQLHKLWNLEMFIVRGRTLPYGLIDPYVEITAYDYQGYSETRTTEIFHDNRYPEWNEELGFGNRAWRYFGIRAVDYNNESSDSPLSSYEEVYVSQGPHRWQYHHCNRGVVRYHYYLRHQNYSSFTVYNVTDKEDSCYPNPCQNGGVCTSGQGSYTCHCPPGWGGKDCHVHLPCYNSPCQHGGSCSAITDISGKFTYTCSCLDGWTGDNCHIREACQTNSSCQNGGTCDKLTQHFGISTRVCSCPSGWTGTNCHIRPPCRDNPCANGGKCHKTIDHLAETSSYVCSCRRGWTGTNCDIRPPCHYNPCANGGKCHEITDRLAETSSYICSCQLGWTGTNCHIRLHCYDHPCLNGGVCTDIVNKHTGTSTYQCSCPSGWKGNECQTKHARLEIYIDRAWSLRNADIGTYSDPYVGITAYHTEGYVYKKTHIDSNDLSPDWNERLSFGTGSWKYFYIRVLDYDYSYSSTSLSSNVYFSISPGFHERQLNCYDYGKLAFYYYF